MGNLFDIFIQSFDQPNHFNFIEYITDQVKITKCFDSLFVFEHFININKEGVFGANCFRIINFTLLTDIGKFKNGQEFKLGTIKKEYGKSIMKFYINSTCCMHDNPDLVLYFNVDILAHLCNLNKYKYEEKCNNVIMLLKNDKKVIWEKTDKSNEDIIEYSFKGMK